MIDPTAQVPATARALVTLALLTVIWGLSVPMMKFGLHDVPAGALVTLRYLVAAPCFLVLLRKPLPKPGDLARMAALGWFGVDAGQYAQMEGVRLCAASVATMITALIPVLTVILASVRLRQRIRPAHVAGFALALGGIAVAVFAPGEAARSSLTGEVLVLFSCLCIAGYYVFGAELGRRVGVLTTAAWSTIFAALGLLPVAGFAVPVADFRLTGRVVFVALYLGVLVTVLGIWIFLRALASLPARIAGASQYGQPLVGIAASAALFGDPLGPRFLAGTALVLGGIALSAVPARR
ncbi:MAG: DMT family transporter [Rhodospirillales bacterium]|nr:DMT family transporter [Rhodospirillales bacterium]